MLACCSCATAGVASAATLAAAHAHTKADRTMNLDIAAPLLHASGGEAGRQLRSGCRERLRSWKKHAAAGNRLRLMSPLTQEYGEPESRRAGEPKSRRAEEQEGRRAGEPKSRR